MKRNKLFILGICTVMVALVSLSLVSGTWAKYTSTVSGEDSARVAKWAWNYKGANLVSDTVAFDLFATINDTGNSADETDVADGLIAPGTSGSFTFSFENESEVTADYTVDYTVTNVNNIPVKFSVDGTTWTDDLADITGRLAINDPAKEVTIQWKWDFERTDGDAYDTNLGVYGAAEIKVRAEITFVQVD